MRRKKPKTEGIGNIIKDVIKKLDTKTHGAREEILGAWQRISGEKVLAHTRPVAIKRKVLTIEVDSSTWLYELSIGKKKMLDAMKKAVGSDKIEDIRFRMGEIT